MTSALCPANCSSSMWRLSSRIPYPSSTRRPTALPEAEGWIFSTTESVSLEVFSPFEGLFWGSGTAELQRVERSKREDTDAFYLWIWWAYFTRWLCWWTVGVGGGNWQTQPSAASPTANDQQIKDCPLNSHQCLLLHSFKELQQCCASVQCCFSSNVNEWMFCGWFGECTKMFCSSVICSQTPLSTPTLKLHSILHRYIFEWGEIRLMKRKNAYLLFMVEPVQWAYIIL